MEFTRFEENVFLTTVLIENLTDKEFGTGFLMRKPHPSDPSMMKILLFSNKHVFWGKKDMNNKDAKKEVRLTFHKKDPDGSFTPGNVQRFQSWIERKEEGYFDHPDPLVDVACANISTIGNLGISLNIKQLDTEKFFGFERPAIVAGSRILFVGYPTGFYDRKHYLPVMRVGSIASIPSIDFNGVKQILLDAQVFPGSSGSPVFIPLDGQYKLLGIVSSGIAKKLDSSFTESVSDNHEKISDLLEWVGLGLLFTNETIKEVYELA